MSRVKSRAAWLRSRRISVPLGWLTGVAAMAQLRGRRHFIAEHPQGSDLWRMTICKTVKAMKGVVSVILHQCMAGLRGPRSGLPIKKPTEFCASNEALTKYLQDLTCNGRHQHAQIDAREPDKAKDAARWPLPLCHSSVASPSTRTLFSTPGSFVLDTILSALRSFHAWILSGYCDVNP